MKKILTCVAFAAVVATSPATAQEVCINDAEQSVSDWSQNNSVTLRDLWAQHDAAANPAAVVVSYRGQPAPLFFALEQETTRYKAGRAATQDAAINRAEDCASDLRVALPRQAWDIFRTLSFPGLPEEKLRVDFAELQRGNLLGGEKSAPRVLGRQIDETLNPFRW